MKPIVRTLQSREDTKPTRERAGTKQMQERGKTYRWNGEKHDDQLLLTQNWMPDEDVAKPRKSSATFFDERIIGGYVIAIDWQSLLLAKGPLTLTAQVMGKTY